MVSGRGRACQRGLHVEVPRGGFGPCLSRLTAVILSTLWVWCRPVLTTPPRAALLPGPELPWPPAGAGWGAVHLCPSV